jgi:hypothetical protein
MYEIILFQKVLHNPNFLEVRIVTIIYFRLYERFAGKNENTHC